MSETPTPPISDARQSSDRDLSIEEYGHRAYVGPMAEFDVGAARQFNLLTMLLGLREYHHFLEIGCGSLRAGRLLIPYLMPDRYCGLEPNRWLVEAGLAKETGHDLRECRRPLFLHNSDFALRPFERVFDYILAQSIFSHTSQAQMATCLREAKAVLGPDGLFAASFHEGEEDYDGNAWVYPESVTFRFETVERIAAEAGLRCEALAWGNQNMQRWVVFRHADADAQGRFAEFSDLNAAQAEIAVLRGRLESMERKGVSPADLVRMQERLRFVGEHPALQDALAKDPALHEAVFGAVSVTRPAR